VGSMISTGVFLSSFLQAVNRSKKHNKYGERLLIVILYGNIFYN